MNNRERFQTALAAVGIQRPNYDIFMAVYDCMYPTRTNDLSESLVTCSVNRHFPHVQSDTCKDVASYPELSHTEYQVPYSEGGNYNIPDHVGDTVKILPPSKPMVKDEPAVGGCVIPIIRSIVPVVPSKTPRNVIADIRESGIDHFVDEPDEKYPDENGGRN